MPTVATRRIPGSGHGPTTLNRRRLQVFLQSFAGTSASGGIKGLDYTLQVGKSPQITGTTPADGHIDVWVIAGEAASLKVMGTEFTVSALADDLFPVTEIRGVQQRLNMLGYDAGPLHGDNTKANTWIMDGEQNERAIINFQCDNDPLFIDGLSGTKTQPRLRKVVQDAGGE